MTGNIDFGAILDASDAWIGETASVIPTLSQAMAGRETATVLIVGVSSSAGSSR
jgi:hypothetical protein